MGRLREPLSSLARADAVVLTNDTSDEELAAHQHQQVWRVREALLLPTRKDRASPSAESHVRGTSSISCERRGSRWRARAVFAIIILTAKSDVRRLLELRKQSGATAFVTTEKDAINLGSHLRAELQPLHIVPVAMRLENADAAVDALLRHDCGSAIPSLHETI